MNLDEIAQENDLRKISFADLFYKIYRERDGVGLTWKIIDRLDPKFRSQQGKLLEEANKAGVRAIREYILGKECARVPERFGTDMLFLGEDQLVISYFASGEAANIETAIEKGFGCSSPCIRIALSGNRVLDALSVLPYMESDQDLIIFFGRNFHATLQSVDAYTGLVYTHEFFKCDGNDLGKLAISEHYATREDVVLDVVGAGRKCELCVAESGSANSGSVASGNGESMDGDLTSAVEIEKPQKSFAIGDRVNHKSFGVGTIEKIEGDILYVRFVDPSETKRLLKDYAPIMKL